MSQRKKKRLKPTREELRERFLKELAQMLMEEYYRVRARSLPAHDRAAPPSPASLR